MRRILALLFGILPFNFALSMGAMTTAAADPSTAVTCVHRLQTSFGVDPPPQLRYSSNEPVMASSATASRLCVYEVTGWRILAPAGWSGSGQVGADGGKSARVQDGAASVSVEAPSDFGSIEESAPFFSSLRADWKSDDMPGPAPTAIPGLREKALGPHVMRYSLPESGGITTDGVIVDGSSTKGCLPTFIRVEARLSAHDGGLASAILGRLYSAVVQPMLQACKQPAPSTSTVSLLPY